jgi:site-specific DNA-methyltransferase (cytosine-N4-specific)
MINKIFNEPCLETLSRMPDKSIDCVITSPPYWQLRDYGYEGQWGLEPTFHEYLEHLWEMMDDIYRVLKDEGTCWINLGDSYNNSGWAGNRANKFNDQPIVPSGTKAGRGGQKGYPNKCLVLLPHRFAIGCIDRGWILRNDIIWAKPNGMPEPVTDRFTKKHEYIFFMVKSEKYYFDLDSIREKHSIVSLNRDKYGRKSEYANGQAAVGRSYEAGEMCNPKGKNPGSVSDFWDITTKPSSNKHYASYNDELLMKPILAGCPEGGIIYDPFMGTGTTAITALRANRNFIGSEMSTEYIKICENNIAPYLQQTKLF